MRSFSSMFSPVLPQVVNPHQVSETRGKVFSQLIKLEESSAPGNAGFNPKLLKICAVTLSYPLFQIFIKSLRDEKLPLAWKHSLVTPLLKLGC